jgi:hypothetical protein
VKHARAPRQNDHAAVYLRKDFGRPHTIAISSETDARRDYRWIGAAAGMRQSVRKRR